ncbi:outer membrane protein OmpA-like peptidoglycan-associated protein [Sphingopyxis italica]|uniref:Outer membrane protein OmpA-like peptidoglycan-associated protein n=1 Tax=Sphingopyxis italica TaxID=1129133 RepID=A0A7X5XT92_9SPHN|nr:OmpA family protein [Sphingopyxis italica]NJB90908.1 outer membrane protein OmpA-like peptidoglycan-associated protein [Sphingopyxis italica]
MAYQPGQWMVGALAALALVQPSGAMAQPFADRPIGELKTEVRSRYDAALAMSIDPAVAAADSNSYAWASEAKVQCGIALGFLKSNSKDAESLRRCDFAYGMMTRAPQPAAEVPLVPPPPSTENCPPEVASTFYFDWDSTTPPVDAAQSVAFMAENRARCGWAHFTVVGHTDRSGPDSYNDGLALRRAHAIADMMGGAGIPAGTIAVSGMGERQPRVQTVDGQRTPENRRVEVEVNGMGGQ